MKFNAVFAEHCVRRTLCSPNAGSARTSILTGSIGGFIETAEDLRQKPFGG